MMTYRTCSFILSWFIAFLYNSSVYWWWEWVFLYYTFPPNTALYLSLYVWIWAEREQLQSIFIAESYGVFYITKTQERNENLRKGFKIIGIYVVLIHNRFLFFHFNLIQWVRSHTKWIAVRIMPVSWSFLASNEVVCTISWSPFILQISPYIFIHCTMIWQSVLFLCAYCCIEQ